MRPLYLAILVCSLPRLCAAGPNAAVEIDVAALSPLCGLSAGGIVEMSVAARNMSGVRQIKFEFSWEPPAAIVSAFGTMGEETAAEAFINPGSPFVEGDRAEWGIAVFGGEGLAGEGHLANLGFELAADVGPETRVDIYLDAISLGLSFAERDTIYPVQGMVLGNYCDTEGQVLQPGLFLQPAAQELPFSPMGTGNVPDQSAGEALVTARLFDSGRFRVNEITTWDVDNRGSGTVFALIDDEILPIAAGVVRQVLTTSNHRGNAHLLLDAESGADAAATTIVLNACGADALCATGQIVWASPVTAILTPEDDPQPRALTLEQNYPNPFNAGTTIAFTIPPSARRFARLEIFNLSGQKVAIPFAGSAPPGQHAIHWDGRSTSGALAASGLYLYRLSAVSTSSTSTADAVERHRTMLLLR